MSLLSYQLQTKRYQRELGLDYRKFNALDVKYSDVNLLKHLQILNPIIIATAAKTGFWGTFVVSNEPANGSSARYMNAYLAYNNVPLTSSQQINSNLTYAFNVAQADRLPLPSSTLQLKITFQSGTTNANIGSYTGFEITDNTMNPLDQENTLNLLVNANNYDNGECTAIFVITYVP